MKARLCRAPSVKSVLWRVIKSVINVSNFDGLVRICLNARTHFKAFQILNVWRQYKYNFIDIDLLDRQAKALCAQCKAALSLSYATIMWGEKNHFFKSVFLYKMMMK